jgi:hypothetical protein
MRKETGKWGKEMTIIGIVREINNNWKSYRVGIATGNEFYTVKPNEEGDNLLYEVGNKVEATGIISRTKEGPRQIEVSDHEVFEMDEDDFEEFGDHSDDYYFRNQN